MLDDTYLGGAQVARPWLGALAAELHILLARPGGSGGGGGGSAKEVDICRRIKGVVVLRRNVLIIVPFADGEMIHLLIGVVVLRRYVPFIEWCSGVRMMSVDSFE